MRTLLAALTLLTLAQPALAADLPPVPDDSALPADAAASADTPVDADKAADADQAADKTDKKEDTAAEGKPDGTDMMDWYQTQRKGTLERSLKDEAHYKDRWPNHIKERYGLTVHNADNTPTPYDPDATNGAEIPAMAARPLVPEGVAEPEPKLDASGNPVAEDKAEAKPQWPSEKAQDATSQ